MCKKMVDSLAFWRQYEKRYYHICHDCVNNKKTVNQILNIGWHYGAEEMKEKMKGFIDDN